MTEEEFFTLLRSSPPHFRRVLIFMRFTGCRPCELRSLRWSNIDFDKRVIVFREHKTADTTNEPRLRIIPLVPATFKLLRWIQRNQKRDPVDVIRELLADGPIRAPRFRKLAFARGVPKHDFYIFCRRAGARCRKVGPPHGGYWVWELHRPGDFGLITRPNRKGYYAHFWKRGREVQMKLSNNLDEARERLAAMMEEPAAPAIAEPTADKEHVFLNLDGQPWKKLALSCQMQRIKRRAKLPPEIRLYQCRHHFASELVRAGVNLKLIADLLGHTTLYMTLWYCHTAGDAATLQETLERAMQARSAANLDRARGQKGGAA